MPNFIQKIKKVGFYGLAIIGALGILLCLFLFVTVRSTLNRASSPQSPGVAEAPLRAPSFELPNFFGESSDTQKAGQPSNNARAVQEGQLTQRKIIKNGSFSLLVKKAEEASQAIQLLAKNLGGFVSEARIYESSGGMKSGTVIIRVPADRFDEAITAIKGLAVRVEDEHVSAQDVTEQFVDLEARLRNAQAQEAQYLEIMKRAYTVEEILKVQQRLGEVRGQIEQLQGQLQYLSRQVDMSTIAVSLASEADVKVFGIYWRPLLVIKQSFRNMIGGLTGYIDAMVGFIFKLPVIILWLATIAAILIIAWRAFRWIRRRFFS